MSPQMSQAALAGLIAEFAAVTTETIVITSPDTTHPKGPVVLYANPAALRVIGMPAGEYIGDRCFRTSADQNERLRAQLIEAARTRQPVIAEWEGKSTAHSGSARWLQINVVPLFNPDKSLKGFVRVGRDITERKHSEQERETTQRLLASVFGVIDNALAVLDHNGKFIMINTALTRRFGWSVMDILGKDFTAMIAEANRHRISREILAQSDIGVTARHPAQLLHRNGTVEQGEIVATSIEQPGNSRYFVLTLFARTETPAGAGSKMEQTLKGIRQKSGPGSTLVAGKLQLIGLQAIRDIFADRWPGVSEQVFTTAEQILKRHLQPGDVYERTKDDGFLICFPELTETEGQFKARTIGQEIRERLIGEIPEMSTLQVDSFAAQISLPAEDGGEDGDITSALDARLNRERKRVLQTALDTLRTALVSAEVAFQAVRTDTNHPAPLLVTRLPPFIEEALQTLRALGENSFSVEAETLLLTGAAERVLAEVTQNRSDLILVPTRFETLTHRRDAERWLQIARTLGEPGKRRLMAEITDLSRDTARSRLADLMIMTASLFRTVALELPSADPSFLSLLPRGIPIVTIPVQRLGNDSHQSQAEAAQRLLKSLATRNTRLMVKGVSSTAQAASLARAGVPLLLTSQVSW